MNLIDWRQVGTQILGFLLTVWILQRYAWRPLLGVLEARRQRIAGQFQEAERRRAEADSLKLRYEQELRTVDAQARKRLQEAVAEGQRVAGEIKAQAQKEAVERVERARDEIAREHEKSKEVLKEHVIQLALRSAEKVLRQNLDDAAQRRLVNEFIDEVGAAR